MENDSDHMLYLYASGCWTRRSVRNSAFLVWAGGEVSFGLRAQNSDRKASMLRKNAPKFLGYCQKQNVTTTLKQSNDCWRPIFQAMQKSIFAAKL